MNRYLMSLGAGVLVLVLGFGTGMVRADGHAEGQEMEPATPIEIFACRYNEGQGPADMEDPVEEFNDWADDADINYSAWTLTPYYFGPEQEFDFLWLGGSPNAKTLGSVQDAWLATGGDIQDEFNEVATCNAHGNFAALQFKKPPERENPSNVVISFSDCNMAEGMTFGDVAPALGEWAAYREGHGSTAGMWVLFPAYGSGGEEFDFKFVASHQNLADQGADWDQYSEGGWQKAEELFAGKLECDSSRVYLATNRRMAADDDE